MLTPLRHFRYVGNMAFVEGIKWRVCLFILNSTANFSAWFHFMHPDYIKHLVHTYVIWESACPHDVSWERYCPERCDGDQPLCICWDNKKSLDFDCWVSLSFICSGSLSRRCRLAWSSTKFRLGEQSSWISFLSSWDGAIILAEHWEGGSRQTRWSAMTADVMTVTFLFI